MRSWTRWLGAALALGLALAGAGCPTEGEDPPPTGIEVVPPEILDFGTVYECTEHHDEIRIINHGPDTEDVSLDVDGILFAHMVVVGFTPDVTLEEGDEYAIAIGVSPGAGGAAVDGGMWDGSAFITTQDRIIEIKVRAEIVEGNEC